MAQRQQSYVVQQPPRQYVQSAAPVMYTQPAPQQVVIQQEPAPVVNVVSRTTKKSRSRATPVVTSTTVVERVPVKLDVQGQLVANAILVGFLLFSFHPDKIALNKKAAEVLSLQLVAFGCFLAAMSFYTMYLQRGASFSMRSWVYCAQALSTIGLILLIAAVCISTRIQLGEEYETAWLASVTVMLCLVIIPIVCDVAFGCWRAAGSCMDMF